MEKKDRNADEAPYVWSFLCVKCGVIVRVNDNFVPREHGLCDSCHTTERIAYELDPFRYITARMTYKNY